MICPLCHKTSDDIAERCRCGYRFVVSPGELQAWFNEIRAVLENGYLPAKTPYAADSRCALPVRACLMSQACL